MREKRGDVWFRYFGGQTPDIAPFAADVAAFPLVIDRCARAFDLVDLRPITAAAVVHTST